jgi:hypothetical protein
MTPSMGKLKGRTPANAGRIVVWVRPEIVARIIPTPFGSSCSGGQANRVNISRREEAYEGPIVPRRDRSSDAE